MQGYDPVKFPVPELVSVPRVIGMTEQAAKDTLHEARFKVAVKTVDSYLPAGTVAEQAPDAGVRTIPNTTVTIYLSSGDAPMSLVPNVVGLPTAVASARLRALNFFVNVVEKPVSDEELDRVVLGQLPKPGTELAEGSTVTINIGEFEEKGGGGTPSPEPEERR
jgi:beta-lactam-binding protein with PASTA domain